MNFDFSDDAKTMREAARKFLDANAGAAIARKSMNGTATYDTDLWKAVIDLGWTAARVPEEFGGIGLTAEESCVLAEEAGRSLAPIPLTSTLVATEALLRGTPAQQARWFPGIADGSVIACTGWGEGNAAAPSTAALTVKDGKASGVKMPIADLIGANLAIITAKGPNGVQLYIVDLAAAGVSIDPVETLDLVRRSGRLTLENAAVDALGDADTYQDWLDRAAVLAAFEALGTTAASMDMTVAYAKDRVAFGQRIGRYQGVKHKCADMYIKLELARAHALHGAWAMGANAGELRQAASAARIASLDALSFTAEETVQLHGGIGFTWESDCQFYYRRNRQLASALGSSAWWADRLVRALERRNAA